MKKQSSFYVKQFFENKIFSFRALNILKFIVRPFQKQQDWSTLKKSFLPSFLKKEKLENKWWENDCKNKNNEVSGANRRIPVIKIHKN